MNWNALAKIKANVFLDPCCFDHVLCMLLGNIWESAVYSDHSFTALCLRLDYIVNVLLVCNRMYINHWTVTLEIT